MNSTNLPNKKKKELPTTDKKKQENRKQEESVLSLHPTDSSDNEDNMSVNSDDGNPDIYI